MTLLDVSHLSVEFHTSRGVMRPVEDVSFTLDAGETMGIVGESGCGKSVTALSLMGLLPRPAARVAGGAARFEGRDLITLSDREMRRVRGRRIAMIFQDPMTSLSPIMTVGRQLGETLQQKLGMTRRQARRRSVELLEMVEIPNAAKRVDCYPHEFSGGMRQRVVIAMALSCEPKLVLADEPTTALDVTIQAQILTLLRNAAAEIGTAVVLITHDLGVVAGMTQRVHVMYGGKIVEEASTGDLFARPKMPYTVGLLNSIPRVDQPPGERLASIEGMPPDLVSPPAGCRFQPRCGFREEVCASREPELLAAPDAEPGHLARCWATQSTGWLAGTEQLRRIPARQP